MNPNNMFCWMSYWKGSVPGPLARCDSLIQPKKTPQHVRHEVHRHPFGFALLTCTLLSDRSQVLKTNNGNIKTSKYVLLILVLSYGSFMILIIQVICKYNAQDSL